jgi:regulator of RNase E activity RraA
VRGHRLEGSAVSYRTLDVDDIVLRKHVLDQPGWGKVIVVDSENYA